MVNAGNFALRVTENGQGPVVLLSGELDIAAAPQLRECLQALLPKAVTLDFTDVTFMDSTGIGVLVAAQKRAEEAGGCLLVRGVQPAPMKALRVTGVADLLDAEPA